MAPVQAGRLRRYVLASLLALGRHTISGHIATAGGQFDDWSAQYRMFSAGRCQPGRLFAPTLRAALDALPAGAPAVAALDDTRLRKQGRKIPGVSWHRDPLGPPFQVNLILAQRFVQLSLAAPAPDGSARMIPVDLTHAPAAVKPGAKASAEQIEAWRAQQREQALPRVGHERLCALRQSMDQAGHAARPLVSVVDGGYTNGEFFKHLPANTAAIGRVRADAKLYHLPEAQAALGRRRIYGAPAPTPKQLLDDKQAPWQEIEAFAAGKRHVFRIKTVAEPLRWRATGALALRLVVIAPIGYRLHQGGKLLYRQPAYLLCTDPEMSLADILQHYLWRWEIEVNFRDEKTILGAGQAQVRHPNSVGSVPAAAVAAYAMLLWAGIRAGGDCAALGALPPPKWQRKTPQRASTQNLINHLRAEVWGQGLDFSDFASGAPPNTKSEKWHAPLASALFYGAQKT
jgi:hypothetical protein